MVATLGGTPVARAVAVLVYVPAGAVGSSFRARVSVLLAFGLRVPRLQVTIPLLTLEAA